MKRFIQGTYNPRNPQKYKGSLPIIYRSSYELKFMEVCDSNSNIIQWGNESIVIPYVSPKDNRVHRYFLDFNITVKNQNNQIQKYIVEIKPDKQTKAPITEGKRVTKSLIYEQVMFAINSAKWASAKEWAEKHNYKFVIITQNELKNLAKF